MFRFDEDFNGDSYICMSAETELGGEGGAELGRMLRFIHFYSRVLNYALS